MGPIFSVLVVLSLGLVAVFAEGLATQEANAQASTAPQVGQAPTTSDIYCSGFFTNSPLDASLEILGGEAAGFQNEFMERDIIYLNKGRARITTPGIEYMVVRPANDSNPRESFAGQRNMMRSMGTLYTEVARIQVQIVHEASATAEVVFACEPILKGDIAIPLSARQAPPYKSPQPFDRFAPPSGKATGVIVAGKEFQQNAGEGDVVYLNVGSGQGARVGSYFRIFRSYLSNDKDPYQRNTRQYATDVRGMRLGRKMTPQESASLPRTVIGELLVLSVQANSSTGIITYSWEEVSPGHEVELE